MFIVILIHLNFLSFYSELFRSFKKANEDIITSKSHSLLNMLGFIFLSFSYYFGYNVLFLVFLLFIFNLHVQKKKKNCLEHHCLSSVIIIGFCFL